MRVRRTILTVEALDQRILPSTVVAPTTLIGDPILVGSPPVVGIVWIGTTTTPIGDPILVGALPGTSSGVISVSTQQLDVTRGDSAASFTVVLNRQPAANVDITLAEYDPNAATDGTTVSIAQPHLAFTTDNWNTPQTVDVSSPAGSTPLPEAVVQIFGTTDSSDAHFDAQAVAPITVDVTDPTTANPRVTVSANQLQLQVGGPSASCTIALTSQPAADVTVAISEDRAVIGFTSGVQPAGGPIYAQTATLNVTPMTLTFTPDDWNTPQIVTVSAPAGQVAPASSTVYLDDCVMSTDPNYNGLAAPGVTVNVTAPGVLLSTQTLWLTRGGKGDSFTVALSTQPTATVTVTIAQSLGDDALQITPATLTFTTDNWSTPQTVSVGPVTSGTGIQMDTLTLSDSSTDPNYTNDALPIVNVFVSAPAPTGALVLSTQSLTVTTGGPSVTYTIALASQPTADVTVAINQTNTLPGLSYVTGGPALTIAPQTLTFTPDDWSQPQTVAVSAPAGWNGVPDVSLNETVTSDDPNYNGLNAAPVSVDVQNPAGFVLSAYQLNLTRGGSAATYTIALRSQPAADVTITVTQTNGNDPLQISPSTLTFTTDDWNQPQTVTVAPPTSGLGDQDDLVGMTVTTADANYTAIVPPAVSVVLTDPAAAEAGLIVNSTSLSATAGGPAATYTEALASQPAADVTVMVSQVSTGPTVNLGAAALAITPQTLVFTPEDWNQPQTVTIAVPADWNGGTYTYAYLNNSVTSADPNYNNLTAPSVTVNVQSNPTYGLVFSTNYLSVAPGGSSSYTIALASQPAANVTVTISTPNPCFTAAPTGPGQATPALAWIGPSTLTVTPTTLTFTPQNWNVAQTVTVTAASSADADEEFAQLDHAVASSDPKWNNIYVPPLAVTVTPPPATWPGPISIPIITNPILIYDPIVITNPISISPVPIITAPIFTIVRVVATQTALTVAQSPAVFGQTVTLTARVTAKGAGAATPTGTVTFMDGSTVLGTGTLSHGVASLQIANLLVGKHTLTAVFASGTGNDLASISAARTVTIDKATTKVALTASPSPTVFGETVTVTATVSVVGPGAATPGAVVTFMDGSTVLGTGTLNQEGVATLRHVQSYRRHPPSASRLRWGRRHGEQRRQLEGDREKGDDRDDPHGYAGEYHGRFRAPSTLTVTVMSPRESSAPVGVAQPADGGGNGERPGHLRRRRAVRERRCQRTGGQGRAVAR